MRKWVNFWLAVAMTVTGLAVAGTGIALHVSSHAGPFALLGSGAAPSLLRHGLRESHATLALLFVVLILVHVGLHWAWVTARLRELSGDR